MVQLDLLHFSTAPLVLLPEEQRRIRILLQHLLLFGRHLVDAVVSEEHDGAGYPEGDTRRNDGVDFIDNELAAVRVALPILQMLIGRIPISIQRQIT